MIHMRLPQAIFHFMILLIAACMEKQYYIAMM